jgi:hypothetical protein
MKKMMPESQAITFVKNERRPAAFHRHGRAIECPLQKAERRPQMSEGERTTDHKFIKKWVEQRDGRPATVRSTEEDGHAGILRIDFGPKEDSLEEIEWEEFFRKFDESDLAFLYQDRTKDGKLSRFHKFVRRSAE